MVARESYCDYFFLCISLIYSHKLRPLTVADLAVVVVVVVAGVLVGRDVAVTGTEDRDDHDDEEELV